MRTLHDLAPVQGGDVGHSRARTAPISTQERLAWYRERDRDPADLHRRYVRAKFRLREWSEADLRRFHRYRRSLSREQAARLVLARRFALAGLTALALAGLVAGLIYAAARWWKRRVAPPKALPPKGDKSAAARAAPAKAPADKAPADEAPPTLQGRSA